MDRLIGIDFGTSTSVIRTKIYDSDNTPVGEELFVQPVVFNNGASMVPTVVRYKAQTYTFGFDAEIPSRNSEVFRSFKLDLQSDDPEKKEKAKHLTSLFFEYLYGEYKHQETTGFLGDTNATNTTYLSYPVKWEKKTRKFMLETAKAAGFENVIGMDEAEAAIRAISVQCRDVLQNEGLVFDGQTSNIMLIDMGAGTTDIVICKYTPGTNSNNEILTTWPNGGDITFGGQEIDALLKDYIVSKFPSEVRELIRNKITIDKIKSWKENTVSPTLKNNDVVTECGDAENIASYLDLDLEEFSLDRDVLEQILGKYILQFVQLIAGAITDSGLRPEEIDLIVLTGGHSKWYFVEDILCGKTDKFGDLNLQQIFSNPKRILSVALPQETVALGLVYSKISGTLSFDQGEHLWKIYSETRSLSVLQEAADLENLNALNELAFKYSIGAEVQKDTEKAVALFKKAIAKGHVQARHNLGCCYFEMKQYSEAAECFHTAAQNGVPEAFNNLGICYKYGLGVEQNVTQALEKLKQSYDLGYIPAKQHYQELYKKTYGKKQSDFENFGECNVVEYAKKINTFRTPSFYIGENIPQIKINSFLTNNPYEPLSQQTLICYYDDTVFGSGKNGFLLTDKYLYWRHFLSPFASMRIVDAKRVYAENNQIHIAFKDSSMMLPCSSPNKDQLLAFMQKVLDFLSNNQ